MSLSVEAHMASDVDERSGDRYRSRSCDEERKRRHLVDCAGERGDVFSDSESQSSTKSRARFVNPAICIENLEAQSIVSSEHTSGYCEVQNQVTFRSGSTTYLTGRGDLSASSHSGVVRKSCKLIVEPDESDGELTAREATFRQGADADADADGDADETFRLSVASATTSSSSQRDRDRAELKKQEAFRLWLAKKEQEKRDRAKREQEMLQRRQQQRTSEEERKESFRRWLEKKREDNERRLAEEAMRKLRVEQRRQEEIQRRQREKEEKLQEWIRKKEERMKEAKRLQEQRAAALAAEERRRREEGERAYRDWLRTSKHKPLPVPLNQGELSMRGSMTQMYVNPVPWESPTKS